MSNAGNPNVGEMNRSRRLAKYPENIYGQVGTKLRRKNTQKCVNLRRVYGITLPDYWVMLQEQDHKCKICRREETGIHLRGKNPVDLTLAVDHDHETGKVRGLLCRKCNKALGLLGDDYEGVKRALDYLAENS